MSGMLHHEENRLRPRWWRWLQRLVLLGFAGLLLVLAIDAYVRRSGERGFVSREEAVATPSDCILVLGAAVWEGDVPCPMLEDRLLEGIALYKAGAAPLLLLSGDANGSSGNETAVMRQYAIDAGVPEEDIFVDERGLCTYDSLYRARAVYQAERIVVVTQEYHLGRALYIAENMDLEAVGVNSDPRAYAGQLYHDMREIVARLKDFLLCEFVRPARAEPGEYEPLRAAGVPSQPA